VELLALQSACIQALEQLSPLRRLSYHGQREEKLARAMQLAPHNPQVQFIACWEKIKTIGADAEHYQQLKNVIAAYTTAATSAHQNDWGYAEALYLLGQAEVQRHNDLAARDALEQALVAVPDYHDARLLLNKLAVH